MDSVLVAFAQGAPSQCIVATLIASHECEGRNWWEVEAQELLWRRIVPLVKAYAPHSCHALVHRAIRLYVRALEERNVELCEDAVAHLVRAPAAPSAPGRGDAPSSACYIVPQRVSSSGVDAEGIEWRQSLGPGLTIAESREWNDVALTTWEACLSLASFLVERPGLVDGLGVLELGAGLGLLGCMLARFCRPTHVVLTDCSEPALDRMEDTLASNRAFFSWPVRRCSGGGRDGWSSPARVSVRALDWSTCTADDVAGMACQVGIGADLLYDPEIVPALVRTITLFLGGPTEPEVGKDAEEVAAVEGVIAHAREIDAGAPWNEARRRGLPLLHRAPAFETCPAAVDEREAETPAAPEAASAGACAVPSSHTFLLACTLRNVATYELFCRTCLASGLRVRDVTPCEEGKPGAGPCGLFWHDNGPRIRILSLHL